MFKFNINYSNNFIYYFSNHHIVKTIKFVVYTTKFVVLNIYSVVSLYISKKTSQFHTTSIFVISQIRDIGI